MADEQKDPDQVPTPEVKPKKKQGIKGFITTGKQLPYDSSKCYLQMGAAVQASDSSRRAFRRIAIILDDVQVSRDSQVEALLEKLQEHLNKTMKMAEGWKEFELLIQKFDAVKQAELVPLISRAFSEMKTAMIWFQKMLEAHRVEDQEEFSPVLAQLKTIVGALGTARQKKIQAAVAMEERFSKSRRAYWNEKSQLLMTKKGQLTHPVQHQNLPYPVNSVTPTVSLDPKQLLQQAAEQIRAKEKLKIGAKQKENAEKESDFN